MRRLLLAAAVLLTTGGAARAEIIVADSLEWMTVDAALIVKGRVSGWKDTKGPGDVVYRDVTVKVEETLKGKKGARALTVRLRLFKGDEAGTDWQRTGRPYLFFLRQGTKDEGEGLTGKWLPRGTASAPRAIDLREPEGAYGADLKLLTDAKVILARVKQFAKHTPDTMGRQRREVDYDSPVHAKIFAGSSCFLNVPGQPKKK
jgi:hypothetical protein